MFSMTRSYFGGSCSPECAAIQYPAAVVLLIIVIFLCFLFGIFTCVMFSDQVCLICDGVRMMMMMKEMMMDVFVPSPSWK